MLKSQQPIAIFMENALTSDVGKMGLGVLRYSPNPVACVIDSMHAGQDVASITGISRPCPIVAGVREALALGAEALVLGIAPPGGLIPAEWLPYIDEAVAAGMSVVNGLHDRLEPKYPALKAGQWVWDLRVEPAGLTVGTGKARLLSNRRVLLIGVDMAVGKMTAGLEIDRAAVRRGVDSRFVATGQIGITITGRGVPLDAIRLDFASGSIEREVMSNADAELIVVEGQGSLGHPASSANLPLLRGSCPTHLVLCYRAGQTHLRRLPEFEIPPLDRLWRLYEDLAEACGVFQRPKTVAIALNCAHLSPEGKDHAVRETEERWGLPCADPVHHGADRLLDAILA